MMMATAFPDTTGRIEGFDGLIHRLGVALVDRSIRRHEQRLLARQLREATMDRRSRLTRERLEAEQRREGQIAHAHLYR